MQNSSSKMAFRSSATIDTGTPKTDLAFGSLGSFLAGTKRKFSMLVKLVCS